MESYEELKDACKVLNRYSLAEGKRVLIITDGRNRNFIADACERQGSGFPKPDEAVKRLKEKLPVFASVKTL